MQMLGIENVVELSYAPKRRNVYLPVWGAYSRATLSVAFHHFRPAEKSGPDVAEYRRLA